MTYLDVLVNNAGVNKVMPAIELTEEIYDWIVDIDLRTPFFCALGSSQDHDEAKERKDR